MDAAQVDELRAAWRRLLNSEAEVRRLSGYRHQSSDMRRDSARHFAAASEARATISRLLGVS